MENYVESRLHLKIIKEKCEDYNFVKEHEDRFIFELWTIYNTKFVVCYPRVFTRSNEFIKLKEEIYKETKMNTCFYMKSSYSLKDNELIFQNIPFIVEDRIIYLPLLFVSIEEAGHRFVEFQSHKDYEPIDKLGMKAQQILCACLTLGRGVYPISLIMKEFNIPHTSFARAFDQIERLYMNITKYDNQRKFIDLTMLDEKGVMQLISKFSSPVTRQFFTDRYFDNLPLSSFSAMAYLDKQFSYNKYNISAVLKEDNTPLIENSIKQKSLPYNLQNFKTKNIIQEMEYIVPFKDKKCIDPFSIIATLKGRELDVPQIKESVLRLIHMYFFKD